MTNCNRDIKKEDDNDLESQEELRAFTMPFYHTYSKGCHFYHTYSKGCQKSGYIYKMD